ncbi:hypothetical protein [Acinetobacter terrestris]|uniref:hypothetical protein n=1 Tax=Acinetobacter terrestris TaxID=2529843 RepID=UPI0010400CCE|nr:hypothetical protein [Acinetobacter terrestris]TCB62521.1 hypothetical protein E0H81_12120 [Acinetobacter terrestris]
MNLPLKTFYKIDEAINLFRGLFPQRYDIDESYFFQLGSKGYIRLGLFKNLAHNNNSVVDGTLDFDWYEKVEDPKVSIKHIKSLNYCLNTIEEDGSILILNNNSVRNLYFRDEIELSDARFDNLYSLQNSEFCIPEDILKDLFFFRYADKLRGFQLYEHIFYSASTNSIYFIFNEEDGFGYIPQNGDEISDWVVGSWFNRFAESYDDKEKFSDRKIKKEECLIFGEDLQLLLDGKHREPIENILRFESDRGEIVKEQVKINTKRLNSINKIVFALANKAQLDLSNHITAYEKLKNYCDINNLELPNKDTCGNLFKTANELRKSN